MWVSNNNCISDVVSAGHLVIDSNLMVVTFFFFLNAHAIEAISPLVVKIQPRAKYKQPQFLSPGSNPPSELLSFASRYLTIAYILPQSWPICLLGTSFPVSFIISGVSMVVYL